MRRALLFINSKASQTEGTADQIEQLLSAGGLQVERAETACEEDYVKRLHEKITQVELLVVAGGDGTVCCLAEAILAGPTERRPVGIIPLGTANNVARTLGIPISTEGACAVILAGEPVPMDLGRVNGKLFVSVAGMGLSTQVHSQVPAEQKKKWRSLAYVAQAIKLLVKRPPTFKATIHSDSGITRVKALQITVCNGRYYGAHVEVHSEASLNDGLLDVSVIKAESYWKGFVKALLPLRTGHSSSGFQLLQSPKFTIETFPHMNIDVEGSTDLQTPASFEVIPSALSVFAPKGAK